MKPSSFYPLTHPQQRIWAIEQIYPQTPLHNIGGTIQIKGPVQFSLLEKAIALFIQSHDALRLRMAVQNGEPRQYIDHDNDFPVEFIDFSTCREPEREFAGWVESIAQKPFVLENERLFYFAMFTVSDRQNGYLAKFHHIVADGWSINIMTEQISGIYTRLLHGEKIQVQAAPSYLEYRDQEQAYLASERFQTNQSYWVEKYRALPDSFLNASSDSLAGNRKTYEWGPELSARIKHLASAHNCSLNTFFVTAYLLYAHKITGQDDLVIGTPVLNRSGRQQKGTFGMYTSTMPFRYVIDDCSSVLDTMCQINSGLKACYFHQRYPYDRLMQELELKKKGMDQLFNVCVNYYNTRLDTEINGYAVDSIEFYSGQQIYSMQLVLKEWTASGSITASFDYKQNDFTQEQIDDMYAHLTRLIMTMVSDPEARIRQISILSTEEWTERVDAFNATQASYPNDRTIYQLFEDQVEKMPEAIAVTYRNEHLTYKQLNEKANQLARFLMEQGVGANTIVGVMTTHSLETVISVLGIGKAGAAFLPIDPGNPAERLGYVLQDARAEFLLTNLPDLDECGFDGQILNMGEIKYDTYQTSNVKMLSKPDDLVYVIYTSGSTGKPKGTMIEQRGLVNYICWAKKVYVKQTKEVFPLYSSLAFDLTITSLFTPLISGGAIRVYRDDEDEYVLYRILKENQATTVKLTPSHLSLLLDRGSLDSSVKRFIVGGENLKVSLAKKVYDSFGGKLEIINEYGPTEAVVGCMIHTYVPDTDTRAAVPIGRPADNVQIYLLDKTLAPVPVHAIGEIYIAGDGVARGYLNNPELTAEKFIDCPFAPGKRMYKTGDQGRFLQDGTLEYIGRMDKQIKIRGYRVELEEIEKHLLNHTGITEAVVLNRQDKGHNAFLCAYIVSKRKIAAHELKEFLMKQLPDYLIPLHFIEVQEIPLTVNGKVDKAVLEEMALPARGDNAYIQPRTEQEEQLIQVVGEVLRVEDIGVKHNFYHVGGDSIQAIQVSSKMNQRGYKLKVKDILSFPILEEMAMFIEAARSEEIEQGAAEGSISLTPILSYFFSQHFAKRDHYHQSVMAVLKREIGLDTLEKALSALIRHHDSLRINCKSDSGELFYNQEHDLTRLSIEAHDFSDLSRPEQEVKLEEEAHRLAASFDLQQGLLVRAAVFDLGNVRTMLLIAHHLVVDGVSWRIILEDMNTLLQQIHRGQKAVLPLKTSSYQKWAKALENSRQTLGLKEEVYWNSILQKDFTLPPDHDKGADILTSCHTLLSGLGQSETAALLSEANIPYNTEPHDLLLASLLVTLKEWTGSRDMVIELEGHGREDVDELVDVTRTVGWFTSLYPFGITLNEDALPGQIKQVKEAQRRVPGNGIGFGLLRQLGRIADNHVRKFIRFNYLGEFIRDQGEGYLVLLGDQIQHNVSGDNHMTSLLDINCFVVDGRLQLRLTYSRNKFLDMTMERFQSHWLRNLKRVIEHCSSTQRKEFTPSDFDTVDISQEELDSLFS
ncbi:non-ribosomal peptide synthetase [Paenibacillus sp. HW567]|uniref:non-ribosomal peptide synthetase n=1 Tax=Paenibacillus sp. HW567 TaxID=1034769 RepID=UPI0018DD9704|nr:non-ribosomal peptide synthetase [Paenibacillus sp. HW567]